MLLRTFLVSVFALALLGSSASGQSCTGDCNADGDVTLDEVVLGLNIALGRAALSQCDAMNMNGDESLTIDELVRGIETLLRGRRVVASGSCQQPGKAGLIPCSTGTVVRVFECRIPAACTGGGEAAAETLVAAAGEFALQFCTVTDVLIFEAAVTAGGESATYRSIEIVDALQLEENSRARLGAATAGGPDFALDGIVISPRSEATARLLDENGLQNFDREGIREILALVGTVNPDSAFAGLGATAAANGATERARSDAEVDRVIGMLLRPDVRGVRHLSRGDLRGADEAFREGVDSGTSSEEPSNFYYAITRIAKVLLDNARIRNLAIRSGVVARGSIDALCDMKVDFPAEDNVPQDAPRTGEMIDVLRQALLPEVEGAIANLSRVSPGFQLDFDLDDLPDCVCPFPRVRSLVEVECRPEKGEPLSVEIDYGDVLLLGAALDALAANLELAAAYDFDFPLRSIFDESAQDFLALEPSLLQLLSTDSLAATRNRLDDALEKIALAIDSVQAETDDQGDDLLVIAPEDDVQADEVGRGLDLLRQSLAREIVLPIDVVLGRIYLAKPAPTRERLNFDFFFSGDFNDLRAFLPAFDEEGDFDTERFPDPTFGGTTPDLTQAEIDDFFEGGPECAPCEENSECNAYGLGRFRCYSCFLDCTGETKRCGPAGDFATCEDGNF